jgi:hypothetical protein
MPIALEPGEGFPVVLDSDASKPAESRPTFLAKSQSMRGQRKIAAVLDYMHEEEVKTDDLFDRSIAALGEVIVGWKNMGRDYSKEALEDVLDYSEARELLRKVSANQHVTKEEKKSSE